MKTHNKKRKSRISSTFYKKNALLLIVGLFLIIISILSYIHGLFMIQPKYYADYPCWDMEDEDNKQCLIGRCYGEFLSRWHENGEKDLSKARMFLCISHYHRIVISGGGTIANDPCFWDSWNYDGTDYDIEIRISRNNILINDEIIKSGEKYLRVYYYPAFNLWFLAADKLQLKNRGLFHCFRWEEESYWELDDDTPREYAINAYYIYGYLKEFWQFYPLGLIVLGLGIWFLIKGIKKRNSKKQTKSS
jgi:hypothetical protein